MIITTIIDKDKAETKRQQITIKKKYFVISMIGVFLYNYSLSVVVVFFLIIAI
jgi:hypothetical protein